MFEFETYFVDVRTVYGWLIFPVLLGYIEIEVVSSFVIDIIKFMGICSYYKGGINVAGYKLSQTMA